MSGSLYAPYPTNDDASEEFIKLLTCDSLNSRIMLKCLQSKSLDELMRAYESIVRSESRTKRFFGPNSADGSINDGNISYDKKLNVPYKLITENNFTIDVPLLIGITSNEGAFVDGKY